jgi:hypothetical protein
MAIDIGRIAYQAYLSSKGEDLPRWEDLGKIGQDAWRHAACAVLDYIDEEREKLDEEVC